MNSVNRQRVICAYHVLWKSAKNEEDFAAPDPAAVVGVQHQSFIFLIL